MYLRHETQYVVAVVAAIIAVVMLFPDWNGVHPKDGVTTPLGHTWILSPPPPPGQFTGLRVERDWSDNILIAIAVLALGALWIALSPGKAKQE
jgi:hypothetical protein